MQIYSFYQRGLEKIIELYKERYLAEFGDEIADIEFLSEVTEAGF